MPKPIQQNRSAKFIIEDINSNKVYIKYYQKTDEMSIKNMEDSLNTVNNISKKINNIKKTYLKNVYIISLYDKKLKSILEKTYFMKKYLMLTLIQMIL